MFGTCVAETILASVHVRTQQQAGHMDASDLVKLSRDILQVGGRPHMGFELSTRDVHYSKPLKRNDPTACETRHRSESDQKLSGAGW